MCLCSGCVMSSGLSVAAGAPQKTPICLINVHLETCCFKVESSSSTEYCSQLDEINLFMPREKRKYIDPDTHFRHEKSAMNIITTEVLPKIEPKHIHATTCADVSI